MAIFFIAIALVVLAAAYVVVRTLREKRAQDGRLARRKRASRSGRIHRAQRAGR
jgi:hypothetical protein